MIVRLRRLVGPLGRQGLYARIIPREVAKDFRGGRKLARRGQKSFLFQSIRTKSKCAKDVIDSADLGGHCEEGTGRP